MAIDMTVYEARVQAAITALPNPAPAKDLLLLGKAIEATTGSIVVSDVQAEGAAQITAMDGEATARLSAITTAGTTQVGAVNAAGDAKIAQIQSAGGSSGAQPADATLTGLAALTVAADKGIYATGPDTFATFDLSPYARTLLDDTTATAFLATLGVTFGAAAGNVPVLDGTGKLLTSILPALAISDTSVVASQAAMLALTAQRGDLAIRTDLNKSFVLATDDPTTLANWKELLTPTDAVLSVAGLTGAITGAALKTALAIAAADITDAGAFGRSLLQAASAAAAKTALAIAVGDVSGAQAALTFSSVADVATGTSTTAPVSPKALADFAAPLTVTYAATLALDLNTRKDFDITLTGNLTLSNFANLKPGDRGRITLNQDTTGGRTLAVGSYFVLFGAGTMDTGASKTTVLSYDVVSATKIIYTLLKV